MSSKVYYTDFHTTVDEPLTKKLARLILTAGMDQIDFQGKFVAIKMHFGEPGNLAFLRPNYARVVADVVKDLGGKPFLTDCNTLYIGGRKNALDHLDSAYQNGFVPYATGCQVIIADGLKGTDEVDVPVEGGEYVKTAKIGRAVMDADIVISLTHFKCHEEAGVGGAMKNVGMGVYIEVWHRLERGQGVQFDDFAVPVHIRKGQLGHGYQGFAIEVNHIHAVLQRNLVVPSKFPEAGAVDQNLDFWLHHIQQICIPLKAVRVQQIHGNGTDGAADLILQRFQRLLPAGDDPHFVEVCLMGKLDGKLPAHAGAGAGNDRNFHIHSSCDMGS